MVPLPSLPELNSLQLSSKEFLSSPPLPPTSYCSSNSSLVPKGFPSLPVAAMVTSSPRVILESTTNSSNSSLVGTITRQLQPAPGAPTRPRLNTPRLAGAEVSLARRKTSGDQTTSSHSTNNSRADSSVTSVARGTRATRTTRATPGTEETGEVTRTETATGTTAAAAAGTTEPISVRVPRPQAPPQI